MSAADRHAHAEASASAGYEARDVRLAPIVLFSLLLCLVLAASWGVTVWLGRSFTDELRRGELANPMRDALEPPPGPALQSVPAAELAATRARERELLEGTAWIDRENGILRIPVTRALELALQEGFPVAPSAQRDAATRRAGDER